MSVDAPKPGFVPSAVPFLEAVQVGDRESEAPPAAAAIFGAPLDLTESQRSGTHGGPPVVRHVSEALESYSPVLDRDVSDLDVVDLGDLLLEGVPMEDALEQIAAAMAHAASAARLAVMIGGEHTGSLGGYRGIKRVHPDAMLVQLDAHLDIRPTYEGERLTHASWLYQAGEQFGFADIVQLGVRSGAREEWQTSRSRTAWSSPELDLPPAVRARLAERPIYVSLDIDVLDPAHAPGTGSLEPGGVTFRELARFLSGLRGLGVVGFDVMEVSPNLDHSAMTALAAAKLIREAILLFG